jgi:hypothetical protein
VGGRVRKAPEKGVPAWPEGLSRPRGSRLIEHAGG